MHTKKWGAEFFGTLILVFGGCGSAIFAAKALANTSRTADIGGATLKLNSVTNFGIGYMGVALAFGLTVVVGAYAFGHVSGGHFNPAVTLGLATAKRFEWREVPGYVIAQCLGAVVAVAALWGIQAGRPGGFDITQGSFASNAYGQNVDGNGRFFFDLPSAAFAEALLTAVFVMIILGATTKAATAGAAGLAIGLTLTLIHLISIPITNTSVNPARSLGPAVFEGGVALEQLWMFIVFPIVGAIVGAVVWKVATGGDAVQTGEREAEGVEVG
ncbi:MAG: putative aquaporin Z [Acidimicrobiia bacterium]